MKISDAGAAEPGVQGVQLHTHYLLLPLIKIIHFPKKFVNVTSLHTHISEASAAPENDQMMGLSEPMPTGSLHLIGHPSRQIKGPLEIREELCKKSVTTKITQPLLSCSIKQVRRTNELSLW